MSWVIFWIKQRKPYLPTPCWVFQALVDRHIVFIMVLDGPSSWEHVVIYLVNQSELTCSSESFSSASLALTPTWPAICSLWLTSNSSNPELTIMILLAIHFSLSTLKTTCLLHLGEKPACPQLTYVHSHVGFRDWGSHSALPSQQQAVITIITIMHIFKCLLCARYTLNIFIHHLNTSILIRSLWDRYYYYPYFYRWGTQSLSRLGNLFDATQQISGRDGIWNAI